MENNKQIGRDTLFFAGIYLLMILAGAALLYWFQSSFTGQAVGFTQALFTACSAFTLTGWDLAGFPFDFTRAGYIFLFILIQIGAFYLLASSIFLVRKYRQLASGRALWSSTRDAAFYLIGLEIFATVCVFAFLKESHTPLASFSERLFYAVTIGMSALNNAGFVPMKGSVSGPMLYDSYLLHLVLAAFIITGSLGYFVIEDLINFKKLRARMLNPDKGWSRHTHFVIILTAFIVITGSLIYYTIETGGFLSREKLVEAGITSLFNAAGSRTAGFFSVSPGILGNTMLLVYILFMLVGTAFGSTGGGLRVTTVWALFKKTFRAAAWRLCLYAFLCILIGFLCLWFLNPGKDVFSLIFLQVSAFTNTGLSLIPVNAFSGHGVLMLSMFAGRMMIPALAALFIRIQSE